MISAMCAQRNPQQPLRLIVDGTSPKLIRDYKESTREDRLAASRFASVVSDFTVWSCRLSRAATFPAMRSPMTEVGRLLPA